MLLQPFEPPSIALEKHLRIQEICTLLGFSHKVVTRLFEHEPDVVRLCCPGTGKRTYTTLSIPESVYLRVHHRLTHQPLESQLAVRGPLRIIKLRDLHAGVPKKPRQILNVKSRDQLAHGKGIAAPVRPAIVDAAA